MNEPTPAIARDDPSRILPVPLPREFNRFETPVTLLGAGRPGKLGLMELAFERRGDTSRMVRHYYRTPLQMFQPMYYDPYRPDLPIIVLLQNGGGMLQGDRYRIDIECGVGAAAHITTQSAGKLYKCEQNYITQVIDIVAEAGSFVEFLPDVTIPYRDSRFFQHVTLKVDPTATVILGDVLAPGRTAYGEQHDYTLFYSQLEAIDPAGNLLVADRIVLEPQCVSPASPAMLAHYHALAVLYVFSHDRPAAELAATVRAAMAQVPHTVSGVSELPNNAGISARIVGTSAYQVDQARTEAWNAVRMALIGVPAPDMRKA